jgi:hypothetical protein
MVFTARDGRAFVIGLLGSVAGVAMLGASSAWAQNGDDARAILKGMSDYGAGNCVQVTDVYGRLVTQCY